MKRAPPLWEKYLACVWRHYLITSSIPKRRKRKRFYYCYFNMASAVKKMKGVYIFDVNNSKRVELKFYDICATSGEHRSKAVTLFNRIDETLSKDGIDWCNAICCGLGNT